MRVATSLAESGSADFVIPGWGAHPDLVPSSPSAYDDEFPSLSGSWTQYNASALSSVDAGVTPSHLRLVSVAGTTSDSTGVYRSCPTPPFTVTAKLTDGLSSINQSDNFADVGMFVGNGSPGRMVQISSISNQAGTTYNIEAQLWASYSTYVTSPLFGPNTGGYGTFLPIYLRWVVTSASDMSAYTSWSGLLWTPRLLHYDPGFGGTVSCVGLAINRDVHNHQNTALFDWIRFT